MQISKKPVEFANRAEMIELDAHAFSVGAHLPEKRVYVNLYAADGTRVLGMTPEEAWDLAKHLSDAASNAYCGTADEETARQSRERTQSGE